MESDVRQAARAIGTLLDVEQSPGLSCTVLDKRWRKGQMDGDPTTVKRQRLELDRAARLFALIDDTATVRHERRFSPEHGHQTLHGNDPATIPNDLPDDSPVPPVIRLLCPTELDVWGRSADHWRISAVDETAEGTVIRFDNRNGPNSHAEILIDATLKLPVRWTTLFLASEVKSEIELIDVELANPWSVGRWGPAPDGTAADARLMADTLSSPFWKRPGLASRPDRFRKPTQ